ncbi:hypothetical protein GCM10027570_35950 [Streptomonospora sediminis]
MAVQRRCKYCDRQVPLLKDGSGLRRRHYISETRGWGYEFKLCRGSDPRGSVPSPATIAEGRKTKITCPCCRSSVRKTKDFRPVKHPGPDGNPCPGWRDNQRKR